MTLSFETKTLVKYLKDCADAGNLATFEEMNKLVNGNVQYKRRGNLSTALQILKRDYQILFTCVQGQGYQPLLTDVAKAIAIKRQRRIQSETRSWREELETIDTTALDEDGFKDYVTASLKLGIQEFIGSKEVGDRLELEGQRTRSTGLEYAKDAIRELIDVR
ncbi:MAG TPA: hypothetical protein V6D33_11805 [Cyanophyceae cyanobacterium]